MVFSEDVLISNRLYQVELVKLGAERLFDKYKINYIIVPISFDGTFYGGMSVKRIQHARLKEYKVTFYSRLYHKEVGSLMLTESDIVYETHLLPDVNSTQMIGVFKVPVRRDSWSSVNVR